MKSLHSSSAQKHAEGIEDHKPAMSQFAMPPPKPQTRMTLAVKEGILCRTHGVIFAPSPYTFVWNTVSHFRLFISKSSIRRNTENNKNSLKSRKYCLLSLQKGDDENLQGDIITFVQYMKGCCGE